MPLTGDAVVNKEMEQLISLVNSLQAAFAVAGTGRARIDLPQIAVVGGQSSGKSSVLEAVVGKSFLPRGSGIVTRRPLILQLHHSDSSYAEFAHKPGERWYDFDQIRGEIEADTERKCGGNLGVHHEPIVLSVYQPDVLDLTLIDLPGTTKVPVGDQPADIASQIEQMILGFVSKPECIILAVTSANTDLANSDAIALSKRVDPDGTRTIGVLTKLDLMDKGTDARDVLVGASKQVPPLRLGYIGVVNRSQLDINERKTIANAREAEAQFFAAHEAYRDLAERLGTQFLVRRCSSLLGEHIKRALPRIASELDGTTRSTKAELAALGEDELATPAARKGKLVHVVLACAKKFDGLVDGAVALEPAAAGDAARGALAGGARVEATFKALRQALDARTVESAMSFDELFTLVENARGLAPGGWDTDAPLRALIRAGVRSFAEPCVTCVASAHGELVALADDAINRSPHAAAFPALRESLFTKVKVALERRRARAEELTREILDMEAHRLNLLHPDFCGARADGSGAVSRVALIEMFQKRQDTQRRAVAANDDIAIGGANPTFAASATSAGGDEAELNALLGSNRVLTAPESARVKELMQKSKPSGSSPPPLPSRAGGARRSPPPPLPEAESSASGATPGAPARPRRRLSHDQALRTAESGEEDVALLEMLAESYLAIVRKTLADFIPKAVCFRLLAPNDDLSADLIAEADYQEQEKVDELMDADPEVAAKRDALRALLAKLEDAQAAIQKIARGK